jgi:hypothetical protein
MCTKSRCTFRGRPDPCSTKLSVRQPFRQRSSVKTPKRGERALTSWKRSRSAPTGTRQASQRDPHVRRHVLRDPRSYVLDDDSHGRRWPWGPMSAPPVALPLLSPRRLELLADDIRRLTSPDGVGLVDKARLRSADISGSDRRPLPPSAAGVAAAWLVGFVPVRAVRSMPRSAVATKLVPAAAARFTAVVSLAPKGARSRCICSTRSVLGIVHRGDVPGWSVAR